MSFNDSTHTHRFTLDKIFVLNSMWFEPAICCTYFIHDLHKTMEKKFNFNFIVALVALSVKFHWAMCALCHLQIGTNKLKWIIWVSCIWINQIYAFRARILLSTGARAIARSLHTHTSTSTRTKTVSKAFNGNVASHVNNQITRHTANHIHRTHKTYTFVTTNDQQPHQMQMKMNKKRKNKTGTKQQQREKKQSIKRTTRTQPKKKIIIFTQLQPHREEESEEIARVQCKKITQRRTNTLREYR